MNNKGLLNWSLTQSKLILIFFFNRKKMNLSQKKNKTFWKQEKSCTKLKKQQRIKQKSDNISDGRSNLRCSP